MMIHTQELVEALSVGEQVQVVGNDGGRGLAVRGGDTVRGHAQRHAQAWDPHQLRVGVGGVSCNEIM